MMPSVKGVANKFGITEDSEIKIKFHIVDLL